MDKIGAEHIELVPENASAARKFIADRIDDLGEEWEVLVVLGLDQ